MRLALLSEVGAGPLSAERVTEARPAKPRTRADQQHPQALIGRTPSGESAIPAGVNQTETIDGRERAPSKRLSLFAHYQWRMAKASREGNVIDLLVLAAQARRDFAELVEPRAVRRDATDADAVGRLLGDLEGCSAEEAAAWMAAPGESLRSARTWVRRQRVLHGYDPETGEPRDLDGVLARIVSMRREGDSQTTIARTLGISQARVSQLLSGGTA